MMNGDTDILNEKSIQPLMEDSEPSPNKKVGDGEDDHLPMEDNGRIGAQKCSNEDSHDPVIKENENEEIDERRMQGNDVMERRNGELEEEVDRLASTDGEDNVTGTALVQSGFSSEKGPNIVDEEDDSRVNCLPKKLDHINESTEMEEDSEMVRGDTEEYIDKESGGSQSMSDNKGDEHGNGETETSMEVDDAEQTPGQEDIPNEQKTDSAVHDYNISETTHNGDGNEDNELCIEICDVRTVEVEDDYGNPNDSKTVEDVHQCKDLPKESSTTDSETVSPQKDNSNEKNSAQHESDTVSEVSMSHGTGQKTIELSHDASSQQKSDGDSHDAIALDGNNILQSLYKQTSSLHDPELSTISTSGEIDVSPKKKFVSESSPQGQNSLSESSPPKQKFSSDSSPQKPRSVSESSTEAPVDNSSPKTSDQNTSVASNLLCNLANSVMKIKPEPVDSGYENAMIEQNSSTEMLRLPMSMAERSVEHSTLPVMKEITPMEAKNPASVVSTLPVVDQANIAQITINANSYVNQNSKNGQRPLAPKPKGLTYVLAYPPNQNTLGTPVTINTPTATSTVSKPKVLQPKSVRVVKALQATSTTSQPASIQVVQTYTPTLPAQPGSILQLVKTSNGGQNTTEVKSTDEDSFQSDLMQMCNMHQVKSVELTKITDFLQRKNGMKSYKHSKPWFGTKTYPCLECGDSFNLESSLDIHMSRCSMRIKYNCSECNNMETFHNKCQLLFHMRQHASTTQGGKSKVPPPLRISSEQISILSPSREDLESVYKDPESGQDPLKLSCLMCNQKFQEEEHLRIHLGAYDLICSFAYQCQYCPEVLPRACAFKAHQNFHTHLGPYVCPECGKFFVQFGQYSKHLKTECCHLNRIYLLTCGVCGAKVSDGLTKLKQHIVSHVNTYIKCQFCNLAFDKNQSHADHMQKVHPGQLVNRTQMSFVYTCMFCKTLLQKAELIEKHMDIHIPEMKKNAQFAFKCFQCTSGAKAYIFPSKNDLIQHIKESHQQKYLCKFCQKQFTTKVSLDSHVSSIHAKKNSPNAVSKIIMDPKKLVVSVCKICRVLVPLEDLPKHNCQVKSSSPQAKTSEIQPRNIEPMPSIDPLPPCDKLRYICMYCKEHFIDKEDVFKHQKKYCKKMPANPVYPAVMVFCNVCGIPFPNISWLHVHLRDHCKKGYILCRYCKDLAFKDKSDLAEHQRKSCELCVHKPKSPIPSRKMKTLKNSYKQMVCKVCDNVFYSFELKIKHVAKHRVEGKLICAFCDKIDFTSPEEADRHIQRCCQNGNPLEHGYCCTCHKTFQNPDQLVVHLQEHVKEGKLLCCKCQKDGFTSKEDLVKHNLQCGKKLRDSIPGQACTLCREVFPTMNIKQLYRHLTNHVVKGVHICCKCQVMGWTDHNEMKSHQIGCGLFDIIEGKKKLHDLVCFICHKYFQRLSQLQEHIQMHRNIGSLICVNCYRMKWKDEEELDQHEEECNFNQGMRSSDKQTQEEAEPQRKGYITMDHFCEHCGKKYHHKSQLQEHISQEHTSFPCHLCGLAYDSKSALDSHVKMVHDGKKTFLPCDICKSKKISKMFASQIGLQKHMQKAHKHSRRPSGGMDSKDEEGEDSQSSMASLTGQKAPSPPPVKRLRVEGDSAYTCAKCSFVSGDAAKFSEHIKEHNINRSSQCPDCGLCFTIIPALKKHLFMVHKIRDADKHLKEKGLNTEEKEFDSDSEEISPVIKKAKLMNGIESESEEDDAPTNPLECSVCHIEFENERSVRMHMRVHGMAFIKSASKPKRRRSLSRKKQTSPAKSDASEVEMETNVSKQTGEEDFEITTLKEETMETDKTERDKPEDCSVTGETREQEVDLGRVKHEVMD